MAHSPEQELLANQMQVGKVLQVGYNLPIVELKRLLMGLKFDIVIGNPPYKAGMHLKFLRAGIDHLSSTGELIFVHPAEWLVQKRQTRKSIGTYKAMRDRLREFAVEIKLINNPWPNIGLYVPLSVTRVSQGSGAALTDTRTRTYGGEMQPRPRVLLNSLDDVSQWGNTTAITSILRKVWDHQDTWAPYERVKRGDWYVNLSSLTGNGSTTHTYYDGVTRSVRNMYSLVNRTSLEVTNAPQIALPQGGKLIGNEKRWFSFPTKTEAQHALDFITRTKFFRAFLAIIKIDQHGADSLLDAAPWLDWTEEWSDTRIAEFFGFTQEEEQAINEIMNAITLAVDEAKNAH